jgi:hypothetical protein
VIAGRNATATLICKIRQLHAGITISLGFSAGPSSQTRSRIWSAAFLAARSKARSHRHPARDCHRRRSTSCGECSIWSWLTSWWSALAGSNFGRRSMSLSWGSGYWSWQSCLHGHLGSCTGAISDQGMGRGWLDFHFKIKMQVVEKLRSGFGGGL